MGICDSAVPLIPVHNSIDDITDKKDTNYLLGSGRGNLRLSERSKESLHWGNSQG